jgi:dTDP-4-amino-4,6-dideoxygalactose transaminase
MRVPSAAPTRLSPDEASAVRAAVDSVLAGDSWVGGPAVASFEAAFASYLGTDRDVVGVASGTDALVLAFLALGLRPGASVLVAADEGGYAAGAAAQLGLGVRVVDVDPLLGVPTAQTAGVALEEDDGSVAAVVVTHLHGDAVALDELDAWRRDRGLLLVEDCAQAHGLRVGGRHVGLTGDAATFSFYPTKNLGAVGDAGAVVLDSDRAGVVRSLREYGWGERYRVERPGGRNSRLDPLQAAVLEARLPFLDGRNERRRAIADRYRALVPLHGDPTTTVAHHAVALLADRDERDTLRDELDARDVATAVHYPWLVGEMPGLAAVGTAPAAAGRRDRMLSLPCFPELTDVEVDLVCEALA